MAQTSPIPQFGGQKPLAGMQEPGPRARSLAEAESRNWVKPVGPKDQEPPAGPAAHTQSLIALGTLLPVTDRHRLVDALVRSFRSSEELPLRVEKTEGVVGGEACIVRTRIPVWTLEAYRRQGARDEEILASFPTLRQPDLESAWIYVRAQQAEIDAAIRANEEDEP